MSEKIDKYIDLTREFKKLWKMRGTVIAMVIGTIGMVSKVSEKKLMELKQSARKL